MEAACRGAQSAGGQTVGILPGSDRRQANEHVGIAIATGMGWARALIIVLSSDAVIAIDGAYGTLAEIAHAVAVGVPVVVLDSWTFERREVEKRGVVTASNPEEAVELAIVAAEQRR